MLLLKQFFWVDKEILCMQCNYQLFLEKFCVCFVVTNVCTYLLHSILRFPNHWSRNHSELEVRREPGISYRTSHAQAICMVLILDGNSEHVARMKTGFFWKKFKFATAVECWSEKSKLTLLLMGFFSLSFVGDGLILSTLFLLVKK